MDGMHIRPAALADAPAIAQIHIGSWQVTYRGMMPDDYLDNLTVDQRLEMWMRILDANDSRIKVLVAERGSRVIGFCSTGPSRDSDTPERTAELFAIYVDPDTVRQGAGHRLIGEAEVDMRDAGFEQIILWVAHENASARAFYEVMGWKIDGQEKTGDVFGQQITEIRYQKVIAPIGPGQEEV